jgi:phosphoglycerate-specific signal transduction histidine kinase
LMDSPELAAELTHLKDAWKLQASPDHAKARKYFYEVWPNLDTPEKIKEHIGEAQRNFDNIMALKDKLTLHKFRLSNTAHFRALGQLLATLPTTNEDELRKFQVYQQVGKTLEAMHTEANKFVGDKAP